MDAIQQIMEIRPNKWKHLKDTTKTSKIYGTRSRSAVRSNKRSTATSRSRSREKRGGRVRYPRNHRDKPPTHRNENNDDIVIYPVDHRPNTNNCRCIRCTGFNKDDDDDDDDDNNVYDERKFDEYNSDDDVLFGLSSKITPIGIKQKKAKKLVVQAKRLWLTQSGILKQLKHVDSVPADVSNATKWAAEIMNKYQAEDDIGEIEWMCVKKEAHGSQPLSTNYTDFHYNIYLVCRHKATFVSSESLSVHGIKAHLAGRQKKTMNGETICPQVHQRYIYIYIFDIKYTFFNSH